MKPAGVSMRILALAFAIPFTQGCVDPLEAGDEIGLHVTEVQAPASAPANGRFTITLTVTTGGCIRFDRIVASTTPSTVLLAARGIDEGGEGVACTGDIRHEQHAYEAVGPFTDPVTITTYRPNLDPIVRTVRIE